MANSLVGDVIEIELTDDHTATDPTYNVVGKTTDTVEITPNAEVADSRIHGQFARVQNVVSESWELSFAAHVVTGTAQMEALGLIDTTNYELLGFADSREMSASAPALKITAYATEADQSSGTVKWDLATNDYIIVDEGAGIQVEDYSTRDLTVYSRIRPIRLEAGGSLP